MKKEALEPGFISQAESKKGQQRKVSKNQTLLKALRAVLRSENYTLDATSLLDKIDKHPETARRILDGLCPTSDYAALMKLFNYDGMLDHIKTYINDQLNGNVRGPNYYQNIKQIGKDFELLKNRLKTFLGDEREVKYWGGKKVNWTKNVEIPLPSAVKCENSYDKHQDQKKYSLEKSSIVVLDHNDKIQEVALQVLEKRNGTPNRFLFTIRLIPNQKMKEERVKILLHSYASRAGYNTGSSTMEIPLNIEDRRKGLTVYSVKEGSIVPPKSSRWYLHADLTETGYMKMNSIKKRFKKKIQLDANMPEEKRREMEIVRQYQTEKKKVINKRQYQILTVKIRGLLLYSLIESDSEVFKEVIGNISKYNKHDKDDYDHYYDNAAIFINTNNLDQVRRMDFPFLLDYYKFSHILSENFAFDVLKRIAEEFQSRLETISPLVLKFEVTSKFFAKVREHLWGKLVFGFLRRIEYVDNEMFHILNNYHSTIGSYVRRRQRMISALEDRTWSEEISYNQQRLRKKTLQE